MGPDPRLVLLFNYYRDAELRGANLLYRLMSKRAARVLQGIVDLIVIGFFAYTTWLMWRYVAVVGSERMVTVDLPRGIVFYTVLAAFALMFLRSVQNLVKDMTSAKTVREQAEEADIPAGV